MCVYSDVYCNKYVLSFGILNHKPAINLITNNQLLANHIYFVIQRPPI